jgi:hypothetical protein
VIYLGQSVTCLGNPWWYVHDFAEEFSELPGDIKGEEQDEIEHECDNPIIKMKY